MEVNLKKYGKLKLFQRWKLYWQISQVGELIRRFFVMNFFDGVLTALGLILGYFTLILFRDFTEAIIVFFVSTSFNISFLDP